ncbi:Cdc37 Hsp90 binding domain containing protein [Nitzschia inconspicua]|uniref:Hsp90 chaperone protein kinase-targeting subunit n=1 Tax=Nitzschia inconspicua TaxID=303405 RepID=A0A9K3KJV2_9STRA|nr:Cdc37 Hsp90 binding domain containing protein [Nitzschia inconspicua]
MSKPFDYSKWDKIELSDDEEDVHPNIDRESWFRMKHRSRVEREEHEEKDKQRIHAEMEKANQRIKMLERDLLKIERRKLDSIEDGDDDDDDDDDDDLDDAEAIKIELEELKEANKQRQKTLDDYEKNKKWNVDNMFQVKEERTEVNKQAAKDNYTKAGYVQSSIDGEKAKQEFEKKIKKIAPKTDNKESETESSNKPVASTTTTEKGTTNAPVAKPEPKPAVGPPKPASKQETDPTEVESDPNFVYTYHEFTEKYADLCEEFMALKTFEDSKEFLLKHGDILLQEHAANYLLLATLEDEMNGYHDEMKQRAKQSQIVTNIAELAKSWNTHPGNVIIPFFGRLQQREFLEGYLAGVKIFEEKIKARAVVKRKELDAQREAEKSGRVQKEGVDLAEIPREERLGPGGLDPLEVIESLPKVMQDAFESRDVDELRKALMSMDPKDAEYHMNRCIASGLWNAGG